MLYYSRNRVIKDKTMWEYNAAVKSLLSLPDNKLKVLAFSGGKDSTALLGLMLEANEMGLRNWRVINSDTLMEIPFLEEHISNCFIELQKRGIPCDRVTAPIERRFFYSLIGKGIPSPSRNFRWCTQALKIDPLQKKMKLFDDYILLNGERFGESVKRDTKLKQKSCNGSNECGVAEIKEKFNESNIVRPLLEARTCDIWDTIAINDLEKHLLPNSFTLLNNVYNINEDKDSQSLRTGCIGCPLINKDKSLEKLISVHAGYFALSKLRGIYDETRKDENRIMRPDYKTKGAVRIEVRKRLWLEILAVETECRKSFPNFVLVQDGEKEAIEKALSDCKYPKGYSKEHIRQEEIKAKAGDRRDADIKFPEYHKTV